MPSIHLMPSGFDTARLVTNEAFVREAMRSEMVKANRRVYWLDPDPVAIVMSPSKPLWLFTLLPIRVRERFKHPTTGIAHGKFYEADFTQFGEQAMVLYGPHCFFDILYRTGSEHEWYSTPGVLLNPHQFKRMKF